MFVHCIWDPYGSFGWVLKEWIAFPSFSRPLQAANCANLGQISSQLRPHPTQTCPQNCWMPLNFLQHACTLYLGPIWRLWVGIEGMDGVSLLFTAIASCKLSQSSWSLVQISQLRPHKRVLRTVGCR